MAGLDDLRSLAWNEQPGLGEPTLVLAESDEGRAAMIAVLRYFGEDDERTGIDLMVGRKRVGRLSRAAALSTLADTTRGDYGMSAGATLPGMLSYEVIRLRCSVAGCKIGDQLRVTYDEDHPPHCPRHPKQPLEFV
jgi:hypothetical protein